jgi:hypothetical protein
MFFFFLNKNSQQFKTRSTGVLQEGQGSTGSDLLAMAVGSKLTQYFNEDFTTNLSALPLSESPPRLPFCSQCQV